MKRIYRQDIETGEMREVAPRQVRHLHSIGVFETVISPATGERIANRAQMADHNRRTGLTNELDSLRQQTNNEINRKPYTGTAHERKTAIRDAMEQVSSSGFHREVQYED